MMSIISLYQQKKVAKDILDIAKREARVVKIEDATNSKKI